MVGHGFMKTPLVITVLYLVVTSVYTTSASATLHGLAGCYFFKSQTRDEVTEAAQYQSVINYLNLKMAGNDTYTVDIRVYGDNGHECAFTDKVALQINDGKLFLKSANNNMIIGEYPEPVDCTLSLAITGNSISVDKFSDECKAVMGCGSKAHVYGLTFIRNSKTTNDNKLCKPSP